VHFAAVERVAARPEAAAECAGRGLVGARWAIEIVVADHLEERHVHCRNTALVLLVQAQVVVHDVAAGDSEYVAVAEPGACRDNVRNGLCVEPGHLFGDLRLDIGSQNEAMAIAAIGHPRQSEVDRHFAAAVGGQGRVVGSGADGATRNRISGRHAEMNELSSRRRNQFEGAVRSGYDDVESVRDGHPGEASATAMDTSTYANWTSARHGGGGVNQTRPQAVRGKA